MVGFLLMLIVHDNAVEFRYPRLIQPKAVGGGILDIFFALTSDRKELVTSCTYDVAVD